MMPALTFQDVSLYYGGLAVINNCHAQIPDGSVTGIIGLNGAGKTTLLKAALGLRDVNSGTIDIYGYAAGTSAAKCYLSYLPENFMPPEFLTGYEFLYFSCRFYHSDVDQQTILTYGQMLDINHDVLCRRIRTYSKGMRQKLGLIGAVLADAPCLVLDEPMAGLDPAARIAVKKLLGQAHEKGKTIVLSSHILVDMDEICDSLLVIGQNCLQFHGSPVQLKDQAHAGSLEKGFLSLVEDAAA